MKFERIVAVLGGVELGAVGEPAGVMHGDGLSRGCLRAVAGDEFFDDQAVQAGLLQRLWGVWDDGLVRVIGDFKESTGRLCLRRAA